MYGLMEERVGFGIPNGLNALGLFKILESRPSKRGETVQGAVLPRPGVRRSGTGWLL
jgi:hypothetical protein